MLTICLGFIIIGQTPLDGGQTFDQNWVNVLCFLASAVLGFYP